MSTQLVDVAIVGSGFAGALIADVLTEAGIGVALFEAGLPFDEQRHIRHQRREAFANSNQEELFAPYSDTLPHPGFGSNSYIHLNEAGQGQFQGQYLGVVGGTGLAWLGTALRFCPNDFQTGTVYQRGPDWPLSYNDLEPWYCKAEAAIGVAGCPDADNALNSSRSMPFPMPAIPQSYADRLVSNKVRGLCFSGKEIEIVSTPQARNSIDGYNDRPLCEGYSSCVPLCPVGAKYDPLVHLRRALLNGAELVSGAVVHTLDTAADGRVTGANFRLLDGSSGTVSARLFVIAANGIETPKLLLQSNHQYPAGVANQSGLVGCNLMDHAEKHSWAIVPTPIFPYRGPQSTSGIECLRDGSARRHRAAFRTALRNDGWRNINGAPFDQALSPLAAPKGALSELVYRGLVGKELFQSAQRHALRQFALQSVVEMLPDPCNRITLSPDATDRLGLPLVRIRFKLDEYSRRGIADAARLHRAIFEKLGCNPALTGINLHEDETASDAGGSHIMGTTVMGDDPKHSVVDADCMAHGHKNLFIAGSSVFPTGAAANPTLTLCAISLRLAQHLKAALQTN